MKKLFFAALLFGACTTAPKEIPFAVFDAYPVEYNEDLEPVYIDAADTALYKPGDTIEVNGNGRIPYRTMFIRDAETGQLVKPKDCHYVVLQQHYTDTLFTRDEAEAGQ